MNRSLSTLFLMLAICLVLTVSQSHSATAQADSTIDDPPPTEIIELELPLDSPELFEPSLIPTVPDIPTITFARGGEIQKGISTIHHRGEVAHFLGYDWVKLYDPPGQEVRNAKVLLRIDVNVLHYYSPSYLYSQVSSIARNYGQYIDAYEIGNEPNLSSEWLGAPAAYQYARTLCTAYQAIRYYDYSATVVSAGLAPVGRIDGTWDGHYGHNGQEQDEREYIQEFITAGGHHCAHAIGYHPMGFQADFDAAPDVNGGTLATDCTNGFCFRSVEKMWETLESRGITHLPIWATEVGWITQPPEHCLDHHSWQGREWQIVPHQKQAENISGAIAYAEENYSWLENIFVFNLDFNHAYYYDSCEQMRYYNYSGPIPSDRIYSFIPLFGS